MYTVTVAMRDAHVQVWLPVCQVVVGVGHVDESLDEVGALDQAEEHLDRVQTTAPSHTHTHTTHRAPRWTFTFETRNCVSCRERVNGDG